MNERQAYEKTRRASVKRGVPMYMVYCDDIASPDLER